MADSKSRKLRLVGEVVSTGMKKTITVRVERLTEHAKYEKYVRRAKKVLAHDEKEQADLGDIVEIAECRPFSKRKRWRLVTIVRQAPSHITEEV